MTKSQKLTEKRSPGRNTRQLIVNHAAEQFAMRGYDGASINDISAAVGVSKPTLYHHFSDKEEIYTEVIAGVLSKMIAGAHRAIESASTPADQLRSFMVTHACYFQANEHAYVAAQLGFRGLHEATNFQQVVAMRDEYEAILFGLLERGCHSGDLQITDVKLATLMVLSTLNWMARWYRVDGKLQATEIADRYCTMLLNGFQA